MPTGDVDESNMPDGAFVCTSPHSSGQIVARKSGGHVRQNGQQTVSEMRGISALMVIPTSYLTGAPEPD